MNSQHTSFSQRDFLLKIYLMSIAVVGLYLLASPWLQIRMIKVLLLSILGCAFLVGYVLTIRTKRLSVTSHYYIVCLYLILFANATVTGGIGAPGTIWFVLCPLIAFITLSTRFARMWLVLILATVVGFYISEEKGVLPTFESQKIWYFVSYVLFFPMMYSILKAFRREVSKRNIALTTLNQRLEVERKMLQKSQMELLQKSERLKEAETKALERSAKLGYYLDQLIEVKRMEELHIGSLQYSIQAVTQFLVRAMTLENVAIWHVQPDGQSLELLRYLGNTTDVFERAVIYRRDFAEAFDMLSTGAIVVGNVHSREAEQLKSVFVCSPGTDSMINCPYFIDGKFTGFISCRASQRQWSQEDIIFVRAISDTLPLAFKSHGRRIQQNLLEAKQREITEINGSLERKVKARTLELNERNKQLTDFAFTNAHHIRGPICRMLGLKNLLAVTNDTCEIRKIADYMTLSIEELDSITRKISAELNKLVEESD
jgi:energy-converting hydrogenase Eha subunit C